jgi:predicted transcriptional regulator
MQTNPATIVRELRALMPIRQLETHEARSVAERQATKLLTLLDINSAPVDVGQIADLPRVTVRIDANLARRGISGLSESSRGQWRITINPADSATRLRFTLAHEFKHVLDHPYVRTLYPYAIEQDNPQAETICDYFAACLLMPRPLVKRYWTSGLQDIDKLAAYFRVSPHSMTYRLQQLGIIERQGRCGTLRQTDQVHRYFRSAPVTALAA